MAKLTTARAPRALLLALGAFALGAVLTFWLTRPELRDRAERSERGVSERRSPRPSEGSPAEVEHVAPDSPPARRSLLSLRDWTTPVEDDGPVSPPPPPHADRRPPSAAEAHGLRDHDQATPEAGPTVEPSAAGLALDDARFGTLVGEVQYLGELPEERPIDPSKDPRCAKAMGPEPKTELYNFVGRSVAGAVVYLADPPKGTYAVPKNRKTLSNRGCRFEPPLFAIRAGQDLDILNEHDILVNVHAYPKRGEFNVALPRRGMRVTKAFRLSTGERGALVLIKDDVHPWMESAALVFDHPFFATTDENGRFEIRGPPGEYDVNVFAASFRRASVARRIRVEPGRATGAILVLEERNLGSPGENDEG